MKTLLGIILVACALALPSAPAAAQENLAGDGGFEGSAAGWNLPEGYRVVSDAAHGGKSSLYVENNNPKSYRLAMRAIPVKAGMRYRFEAWIKTRGVRGTDSGATICMEWSGKKGWLGGAYPHGRKGNQDWFHVEGVTPPMPKEATSVHLSLYLRRGMTGAAWFDDVRVTEAYPPALDGALVQPNYRGRLDAGSADQRVIVRGRVGNPLQGGLTPERTTLACAIERDGKTLLERKVRPAAAGDTEIALDAAALPAGDYRVQLELQGPDGASLGEKAFDLSKLPAGAPAPTVFIDEHNRTIVQGKPFFPLGWYLGAGPTDPDGLKHLDRLAASPFNTVMPYSINTGSFERVRAYLDALASRNLKIIYSIKDVYAGTMHYHEPVLGLRGEEAIVRGIVGAFKDHPALLAWYVNDELPLTLRGQLDARQRLMRRLDPNHPTWAVLYQVDEFFDYLNSADVLGADPYPIPKSPVTQAADWTRKCAAVSGGRLPLWMVPQAFDWASYPQHGGVSRPPTLDEELVMSYLCLINGAHGLIYYSYFDLLKHPAEMEKRWADMLLVGREMQQLFPALLSAAKPPKLEVKVEGAGVETAVRADDAGAVYVLMANPGNQPASVRVAVPAGAGLTLLMRGQRTEPSAAAQGACTVALEPMSAAALVIK